MVWQTNTRLQHKTSWLSYGAGIKETIWEKAYGIVAIDYVLWIGSGQIYGPTFVSQPTQK